MKIAVASSDGIVVNQHFGRAKQFYIYEKQGNKFHFIEKRRGIPFCNHGEYEDGALQHAIDLIEDCFGVLVLQIGSAAEQVLEEKGITVFVARGYIEDVLNPGKKDNKIN